MYLQIFTYSHLATYIYIHLHVFTYIYIFRYFYIYHICLHIYIYTYIYIHTHIYIPSEYIYTSPVNSLKKSLWIIPTHFVWERTPARAEKAPSSSATRVKWIPPHCIRRCGTRGYRKLDFVAPCGTRKSFWCQNSF